MIEQPNNPLHGIKLEMILNSLVEHFGWDELSNRINIRCFYSDPSIKSSLTFLRKTPWARKKVENLYLYFTQHILLLLMLFSDTIPIFLH